MSQTQDLLPRDSRELPRAAASETPAANDRPTVLVRTVAGLTIVEVVDAEILFAAEAIAELTVQLRRLVDAGHTRMMVDFRGVRTMSSDVLGTLAGLHRRLETLGGSLCLYGPSPALRRMLRICHLDQVFDVLPADSRFAGAESFDADQTCAGSITT